MSTQDKSCTIVPYFEVPADKLDRFKEICEQCVAQTSSEPKCLYYGFSFNGNIAHCREGYADAEAALAHMENIEPLLSEALKLAKVIRLELHGLADELAKLRGPLAKFEPEFFVLEYGFRR
jgi:quinol monooxygenase YgiN